jgi:hypothetical protein
MFSQAEVPLVVDVIPMLEVLEISLASVWEDPDDELNSTTRIAGQAALLLLNKYSIFTAECEVYQIAVGMCIIYMLFSANPIFFSHVS